VESLYLLIPLSIVLVFVIAGLFWWSVRSGQFDDLEGPAHRIMMDEEQGMKPPAQTSDLPKGQLPD
jgi:cbb3-type cytochrome oxidase maturation protein